jgi:hypothetical protein
MTPRATSRCLRAIAVVLLAALATRAACAADADKKRRAPAEVPPLVVGKLKYEAPPMGRPFGYAQDGGIVAARRADTGELVWTCSVYTTSYDARMESDKQDVFIKSLVLAGDGQHLLIVNERGQHFEIGLDGCGPHALR